MFSSYTGMFISSFNYLYQKDHIVIPAAENIQSKCIKSYQIVQKHPETVQVAVVPTESINFISLWRDSFSDEGYNLGQAAMFTFITTRWNASQLY